MAEALNQEIPLVEKKEEEKETSGLTSQPSVAVDSSNRVETLDNANAAMETAGGAEAAGAANPTNNPFWRPRPPPIMGPDGKPLSKNAMKKLRKEQAFLERLIAPPPKRHKSDQIQTGITIGIDMSFDDLMIDKEIKSMVDQIKRCYSNNRTCEKIVHLALTSFTGTSRDEFIRRANGYELWKNFTIHEDGFEKVWPSKEIPGRVHLAELKKMQEIASAKSEAVKAQVLAEKALSAESTSAADLENQDSATANSIVQDHQTSATATASSSSTTATATANQESSTWVKPSEEELKAMEEERLKKEEQLATIPAVKKVVYLSADSTNTITELDENTCYILGGLVDKNRYPGLCQKKAEKLNIETAQLPIGDYIKLSSRRILTVNQVFEILLEFIECKDWKEAFLKVIPQRKLEDKPRVRRSAESWRHKQRNQDGKSEATSSAGNSGTNSKASSARVTGRGSNGADLDYPINTKVIFKKPMESGD
ncbi:tRNA (guanine(9)-N(1))-methyltransferase [Entomortierella beljakovae]|nr:tRNA (guanine(9)-N(1))-methyltransferase [Entomortierella beljakovae]